MEQPLTYALFCVMREMWPVWYPRSGRRLICQRARRKRCAASVLLGGFTNGDIRNDAIRRTRFEFTGSRKIQNRKIQVHIAGITNRQVKQRTEILNFCLVLGACCCCRF